MINHNMEQRTDEWYAIRKGKMTASNANTIQANGKGLETYIYEVMAEYFSNGEVESYTNENMERGKELEAEALSIYTLEHGNEVREIGFVEHSEYVGCSPDGYVGKDGLIEVKCPTDKTYLRYIISEKVDKKYYDQMQMQMYIAQRTWCDYVVYNPNFKKCIVVKRIEVDNDCIDKLKIGIEAGIKLIKEIKAKCKDKGVE